MSGKTTVGRRLAAAARSPLRRHRRRDRGAHRAHGRGDLRHRRRAGVPGARVRRPGRRPRRRRAGGHRRRRRRGARRRQPRPAARRGHRRLAAGAGRRARRPRRHRRPPAAARRRSRGHPAPDGGATASALYAEVADVVVDSRPGRPTTWSPRCWRSSESGRWRRDRRPGRPWPSAATTSTSATACATSSPGSCRPRRSASRSSPRPGVGVEVDPGREHRVFEIARGRGRQDAGHRRGPLPRLRPVGARPAPTPWWPWAGAWSPTPPASPPPCYHRGVPVVHVATTLLGQIDAAIGGKTGVNLPEGKNLVGAFWQPSAVLCDTEVLATLPPREYRSGLGELAKYHFLGGGDLDALPLDERVAACVRIKADGRGRRRARGRAPGHPQLRPHPRPRPRDRRALRPAPRRGGRHRPGLRRRARPTASGASTTPAWPSTAGWWRPTTCRPRCRPALDPTSWSSSWAGTRRRSTASRSCSTAPTASSGHRRRPGRHRGGPRRRPLEGDRP